MLPSPSFPCPTSRQQLIINENCVGISGKIVIGVIVSDAVRMDYIIQ